MKIVVTGSSGFIGSYLCKELGKIHEVIGIDKRWSKGLLWHEDINEMKKFPKADLVYHLAAQTSVMDSIADPAYDAYNNILPTIQLIKAYPDTKIIYTASGGASEQYELLCPYGLSKRVGGEYLSLFHKNAVICNLPNVFGAGGKGVIELFLEKKELVIYGDGNQTRDFVYVDDIVDGLIKAINWYPGFYFLGSGKSVKVIDLAKVTGKSYRFEKPREGELEESLVPNRTPNWEPKVNVFDYLKEKCASNIK